MESLILSIIVSFVGFLLNKINTSKTTNKRKNEDAFNNQIEVLNNVSENLEQIKNFVNDQKNKIVEEQRVLDELRQEKQEIQPILEIDRNTVKAILDAQSKSQKKNIWFERFIGFVFGIAASLLASFLYEFIKVKYLT